MTDENIKIYEKSNEIQSDFMRKLYLSKKEISDPRIFEILKIHLNQNLVRVFDEKDGLTLVHYVEPENGITHVRGIIFNSDYTVVCRSFDFTPEFTQNIYPAYFGDITFSKAYEGTILRLFYHNSQWYLSTHRKINGRNSRWNGPKFGELFDECFGEDYSRLNQELCYIFLLTHPKNKFICSYSEPKLYHVGTFSPKLQDMIEEDIGIEKPERQTTNMLNKGFPFKDLDWNVNPGVIIYVNNFKLIKIVTSNYYRKKIIRGNEPNLRMRYLTLARLGEFYKNELRELLPEQKEYFDQVDLDIENIKQYLYDLYEYRHINNHYLIIPQEEHNLLKKIYKQHFGKAEKDKIMKEIEKLINEVSVREVNAIIKHMINGSKDDE